MLRTSVKSLKLLNEPAFWGVVGLALLVMTWMLLLVALASFAESALVPWDVIPDSQRPLLGTWERALNDSFENGLAGLLLLLGWGLVIYGWQSRIALLALLRRRDWPVPFRLAANGVFFALFLVFQAAGVVAAVPLSVSDIGYHRTWPGIVLFGMMVIALVVVQRHIGRGRWFAHTPG